MPFLCENYEEGWPVDIYLRTALKKSGSPMTAAEQRKFDNVRPCGLADALRVMAHMDPTR